MEQIVANGAMGDGLYVGFDAAALVFEQCRQF